jgi:hypothetical protein
MSGGERLDLPAVLSALERLTEEELVQLNHIIVARLRLMRQIHSHNKMMMFRVGQPVRFTSGTGQVIRGVVKSHNRKSVTVWSETHGSWRVAPEFRVPE